MCDKQVEASVEKAFPGTVETYRVSGWFGMGVAPNKLAIKSHDELRSIQYNNSAT
jgi:hypothetical protein